MSNSLPLISIITPAYNAAQFLRLTIESVLQQTVQEWEMLIVDDASSDNTSDIATELSNRDDRIILFRQAKNNGPALARNAALERARGRYIAFLDSDDLWLPEKLACQLTFMQNYNNAFTYTCYRRITENGNVCGRLIRMPDQLNYRQLLKNTAIATSTVIVDRDKTGPFKMIRTYYDDYALWLSLLKKGFVAYGIQDDLMRYRVVSKSVSRSKRNSARWVWRIYRDVETLGFPYAAWCFLNYAWRAYRKYAVF